MGFFKVINSFSDLNSLSQTLVNLFLNYFQTGYGEVALSQSTALKSRES